MRAVGELDEGVHDALRRGARRAHWSARRPKRHWASMQLEALVGEGGGVDGDLGAHRPSSGA